jgi:hypothetical protein
MVACDASWPRLAFVRRGNGSAEVLGPIHSDNDTIVQFDEVLMAADQPPHKEQQIDSEQRPWDGAELGPWPKRKNQLLAASLAGVALAVLATAVTLAMLIHYDKGFLSSLVTSLLEI